MNPRDGSYSEWTEFSPVPRKAFRPPAYGELLDWVLVIERAAAPSPATPAASSPRPR